MGKFEIPTRLYMSTLSLALANVKGGTVRVSGGRFVVSHAGEGYDALDRGSNQTFRI